MYDLFTTQYWQWISLFPELLSGLQKEPTIDAVNPMGGTSGWAFSKAPVASRKPLRRALRYDTARKHL